MPLYEFVCTACHSNEEHLMKLSETPPTRCASCGAQALQKKLSRASFVLRGTGWYETDFKRKSSTSPAPKPSSESSTPPADGAKVNDAS